VFAISVRPKARQGGIGALGYTIQRPTEDRYLMTREELENKMAMRYGMVEKLGHVAFDEERPNLLGVPNMSPREYSEDTAREIDVAVRDIVKSAYDKALAILTRERETLERGAQRLLEKETLIEQELAELTADMRSQAPEAKA